MKNLKTFAVLAFALVAVLSLATAVQARPNICRLQCTPTISCSVLCTDELGRIITCADYGICNWWGGSSQAHIDGTTNPATPSGSASNQCIPGGAVTTPSTAGGVLPTSQTARQPRR